MLSEALDAPVVLVGTGRCGSTILYSLLAIHDDLGWIPSWVARYPESEWLAAGNRLWSVPGMDRFRDTRGFPKPVEPNALFTKRHPGYFTEAVNEQVIADARQLMIPVLTRIRRWTGRPRLLLKMVGRPVKIELFESIADSPVVVHVTRDLKPTVASLLKVDFFARTGTLEDWRWGTIPDSYLEMHERSGGAPEVIAAIQYALNRAELDRQMKLVAPARRLELAYSELVADPLRQIRTIAQLANLTVDERFEKRLSQRQVFGGADSKWKKQLTAAQVQRLDEFEELMVSDQDATR